MAFKTAMGRDLTLERLLGEGGRQGPFDFRHPYPEPYIRQRLTICRTTHPRRWSP